MSDENTATYAELRSALETKQAFVREGLAKGLKIEGNNVEVSPEDYTALQGAVEDIKELKSLIEMQNLDVELKSFFESMEAPTRQSTAVAASAGAEAAVGMQTMQRKDWGSRFTESEEFKSFKDTGRYTMDKPFTVEGESDITGPGQKDIYNGLMTGGLNPMGFGKIQFDPMIPRPHRTYRVRDLFPVATTTANLIDYFRVLGFTTGSDNRGNARPVADYESGNFGLKPKSQLQFEPAQAPVRTIAHWEAAHRNVIADEPQLQATINNELLYGLALAEDDQILNGDGTVDNLLGLLRTPGIQTYTQESADQKSDALRRAATLSMLANFPGTGYVMHPFDWEDVELQKTVSGGDGQYMLVTNIAVGAQAQVWRQPVVETPAMTEGQFLTGAFGLGAQLYDRQQANIRIAEQHADFFVRNAIVILAEERLALAVKRPESFVLGSFLAA
jgi:HK97 family phage major capsid protein